MSTPPTVVHQSRTVSFLHPACEVHTTNNSKTLLNIIFEYFQYKSQETFIYLGITTESVVSHTSLAKRVVKAMMTRRLNTADLKRKRK